MLMPHIEEEPPTYKEYKNSKFEKHIFKIKSQIIQIDSCSLKKNDKEKLKQKLIELIKEATK
jgi:hypothetical protein